MQFKNLINVGSLSSLLLQTNYIFIAIQSGVNTGCETIKQLWGTEKSTSWVPSENKSDLQALSLGGLTVTRPVQDPLALLSLDNQLFCIFLFVC